MLKIIKKYWYCVFIILLIIFIFYSIKSEDIIVYDEIDKKIVTEKQDDNNDIEIPNTYYVDIKGEVKKPGVYEVTSDKRVIDVISLAGGLTKNADTSIINLSKKLTDEMSIKIYSKDEINKAKELIEPKVVEVVKEVKEFVEKECDCKENSICETTDIFVNEENSNESEDITTNNSIDKKTDINSLSNSSVKININTASKSDLMTISGVGENKAEKIIEYRNKDLFKTIEEIKNVSGIGDALFEKIKDFITV